MKGALEALRLTYLIAAASMRGHMQYKLGFAAGVAGLLIAYAGEFINMYFLLDRFGDLKGWSLGDLVFIYGLAILAWGLCVGIFMQFRDVEEYVVRGDFDRFLVRPLSPFLHLLAHRFQIFNLGQFLFGAWALWYAGRWAGILWSGPRIVFLVGVVSGGALILGGALVLVGALALWFYRTSALYWTVIMPARQLTWYPVTIFPRPVQVLLVFVLPFAFINFFPAHVFLDRMHDVLFHPALAYLTPLVGIAFMGIALLVWRLGLDQYKSSGS